MTRQFFATLTMLVALGCGAPKGQPGSGAAASLPNPDPTQPATSTGADAGQPDAGTPAAPPDAGSPPDCSANASFDSRCFDPGTPSVAISTSDAPQCAALVPVTAPEPTLFTLKLPAVGQGVWACGAVPDGDGHLGACTYSDNSPGPSDGSGTTVLGPGDVVLARLAGRVRKAQPHGFLTEHDGVDYGQVSTLFGWNPQEAGSLYLGSIPYPLQPDPPACAWATAPDSTVLATCWAPDTGASLRRFNPALVETAPAVPLSETIGVQGIDEQQRMLAQNAAGVLRWYDLDGRAVSDAVAGTISGPVRALVGGGFDTSAGVLASGSTAFVSRPSWLAERDGGALTLVRGRRAHAFVRPSPKPCTTSVELLASDGTVCATVEVTEMDVTKSNCAAGGPVTGPALQIGASGSVASRAGWYCQADSCIVGWHVWTRLFP